MKQEVSLDFEFFTRGKLFSVNISDLQKAAADFRLNSSMI
jgi:hypothetical protein